MGTASPCIDISMQRWRYPGFWEIFISVISGWWVFVCLKTLPGDHPVVPLIVSRLLGNSDRYTRKACGAAENLAAISTFQSGSRVKVGSSLLECGSPRAKFSSNPNSTCLDRMQSIQSFHTYMHSQSPGQFGSLAGERPGAGTGPCPAGAAARCGTCAPVQHGPVPAPGRATRWAPWGCKPPAAKHPPWLLFLSVLVVRAWRGWVWLRRSQRDVIRPHHWVTKAIGDRSHGLWLSYSRADEMQKFVEWVVLPHLIYFQVWEICSDLFHCKRVPVSLPSGNLLHSYWKRPLKYWVFPWKHVIFHSSAKLPE